MTFSELIQACRERAPKGDSWSIQPEFWHHDNSHLPSLPPVHETMDWTISRFIDGQCKRFTAKTMEAVLEIAFPASVDVEQQAALVDAVEVQP